MAWQRQGNVSKPGLLRLVVAKSRRPTPFELSLAAACVASLQRSKDTRSKSAMVAASGRALSN